MAVDTELDVTPEFTFSTVQFSNETLNVIITSLLMVFILINIGSATSKLIYFTRGTDFNYRSWLRAFIFANSDDPVRIISWIAHNYEYREKKWNRYRNKLRLQRLFFPLLARGCIFIISIASIALSIDGEKKLQGCDKGDYQLQLDITAIGKAPEMNAACIDLPMNTKLGRVKSVLSYCNCPTFFSDEDIDLPDKSVITSYFVEESPFMATVLFSRQLHASHLFYIAWKPVEEEGLLYFTDASKLDQRKHLEIVQRAIQRETGQACDQVVPPSRVEDMENALSVGLDCSFDATKLVVAVEAYIRNSMTWKRLDAGQKHSRILVNTSSENPQVRPTTDCPIAITVTRPIVNILPLALMLLLWVIINFIVSYATSRHGNALDAGFHLIKETLGHDSTSNPIEENLEREEVMELDLRKWRCGAAGAHVGFIGREGDIPVEDFDDSLLVCGCTQVAADLKRAEALEDASDVAITGAEAQGPSFVPYGGGSEASGQGPWQTTGPPSGPNSGGLGHPPALEVL